MTSKRLVLFFFLVICLESVCFSAGPNSPNPTSSARRGQIASADDFDWRDILPYLFDAAALPSEQGLKEILENSRVLRTYVAAEIRARCAAKAAECSRKFADGTLEGEITKSIDEIVQEESFSRHDIARVDYPLTRQGFAFTEITALQRQKRREAYIVLDFADNTYTALQVQKKYGAPDDTTIFQWFSMCKYTLETKIYVAKAAFTINPVDGVVHRVAISLKRKDGR